MTQPVDIEALRALMERATPDLKWPATEELFSHIPSLLTELEALRAERGRMVEALGVVKRTLEEPQPAIACTIWVASFPAETLYDHICSVIDAQNDS